MYIHKHHLGISQLYSKEYDKAVGILNPISKSESSLLQEAKWYIVLAYVINKSEEEAITEIKQFEPSDWNYEKAQELFKGLSD